MAALQPSFIYFDLDDTLLHHTQAERNALGDIYRRFKLFEPIALERLVEVYHRVNSHQWKKYSSGEVTREQLQRNRFELTLRDLKVDDTRYEEVGDTYLTQYQNHWDWLPGAQQAFNKIRDKYRVGVLTNGFARTQKKKFEQFDLYNQADCLVISEEVGRLKPHPAVFEYATKLTGCEPEEILYVGDSYTSDVLGGANFGWNVAWFTQHIDAKKRKQADFVFSDYKDLSGLLNV